MLGPAKRDAVSVPGAWTEARLLRHGDSQVRLLQDLADPLKELIRLFLYIEIPIQKNILKRQIIINLFNFILKLDIFQLF